MSVYHHKIIVNPFLFILIINICFPLTLQNHFDQCPKFQLPCPNKCGQSIPREAVGFSYFFSDIGYMCVCLCLCVIVVRAF